METDTFFYRLFKRSPETLFELLGLPSEFVQWYRFDAVELKKALRIDGLLQPIRTEMPLYFVEVQYHASAKFYANLFAKVFCFLEENDPGHRLEAADAQVLHLQVLLDALPSHLPAEPGLAEPAEGGLRRHCVVAVHPHGAGLMLL